MKRSWKARIHMYVCCVQTSLIYHSAERKQLACSSLNVIIAKIRARFDSVGNMEPRVRKA